MICVRIDHNRGINYWIDGVCPCLRALDSPWGQYGHIIPHLANLGSSPRWRIRFHCLISGFIFGKTLYVREIFDDDLGRNIFGHSCLGHHLGNCVPCIRGGEKALPLDPPTPPSLLSLGYLVVEPRGNHNSKKHTPLTWTWPLPVLFPLYTSRPVPQRSRTLTSPSWALTELLPIQTTETTRTRTMMQLFIIFL